MNDYTRSGTLPQQPDPETGFGDATNERAKRTTRTEPGWLMPTVIFRRGTNGDVVRLPLAVQEKLAAVVGGLSGAVPGRLTATVLGGCATER